MNQFFILEVIVMASIFQGCSVNEVWIKAASKLFNEEDSVLSRGNKLTFEKTHSLFIVSNPKDRWVIARQPIISIAYIFAFLIWTLKGSNDAKVINYWNPSLPRYSGRTEIYPGAYGYRLKNQYNLDQLERAYRALKKCNYSRQIVLQIWHPEIDFPDVQGNPVSSDIPCNICSLLKVRNHKLMWTQIMRSNDIIRGNPYDFVLFTTLQEIIAGWLNLEVGEYCLYCDSLHLYKESDSGKFSIDSKLELSKNTDNYDLNFKNTQIIVSEIYSFMERIPNKSDSDETFLKAVRKISVGDTYGNMLKIIALYAANKQGRNKIMHILLKDISNPFYCDMWNRWLNKSDLK